MNQEIKFTFQMNNHNANKWKLVILNLRISVL